MLVGSLLIPQTTVNAAANGWLENGTTWNYYINNNKATGWISSGGLWYYLNSYGEMVTGWVSYEGSWYYLNEKGGMESNKWITVDGKQYYLYSNGSLAVNTTTPDGYIVGSDGAWNGQNYAIANTITTKYAENLVRNLVIGSSNSKTISEYDHEETINGVNYFVIHVYDVVYDDATSSHTSTWGWYYVNPNNGKVYKGI